MKQLAASLFLFFLALQFLTAQPLPPSGSQPPLLKLFDQNGIFITDQFSQSNRRFSADTQKLPAGLYLLLVTIEDKVHTFKILKR